MDDLTPVTRTERLLDGEDLTPTNREEMFIRRIYDKTQEIPEPVNRKEYFLKKAGEAGGDVTVIPLSVTDNGTYSEEGKAYSPVTVEVAPPEDSYQLKSITTPTSLATFEASEMPMPSLKVSVEAQQDLHGYDHPWVGGAGKNKLIPYNESGTRGGVYYELQKDNAGNGIEYLLRNTSDSETSILAYRFGVSSIDKSYYINLIKKPNNCTIFLWDITAQSSIQFSSPVVIPANHTVSCGIYYSTGVDFNNTRLQLTATSTPDATFEPYSNICPISGWSEVKVSDVDDVDNPTVTQTTTISLGQTVYGAEVDVVNGVLKITDGYIASYNGETLPSTWISSMDEYAEGTSPTTGAEVCYELANPIIINLTPSLIKSLEGTNNLSVDCGGIIEGEYFIKLGGE